MFVPLEMCKAEEDDCNKVFNIRLTVSEGFEEKKLHILEESFKEIATKNMQVFCFFKFIHRKEQSSYLSQKNQKNSTVVDCSLMINKEIWKNPVATFSMIEKQFDTIAKRVKFGIERMTNNKNPYGKKRMLEIYIEV